MTQVQDNKTEKDANPCLLLDYEQNYTPPA